MLSEKMIEALNGQINKEMYSAYLYFSMSSYAGSIGYKGTANWFRIQAQEEMSHALRIYDYVGSQGGHAVMKAIDEPPAMFNSVLAMFEGALEHEQFITRSIHELVALARAENDYATEIMLQWFVTEQVEEEEHAGEILDELRMVEGSKNGLYMIDRELGQRVFTPPDSSGE